MIENDTFSAYFGGKVNTLIRVKDDKKVSFAIENSRIKDNSEVEYT